MNLWIALFAAVVGYLVGSISFTRIMMHLVAPERDFKQMHRSFQDTEESFDLHLVTATSVREQLGAKYGCLTAILDILKATVPTLVFKLLYPDQPYYLACATAVIVGHIYPLYYRFEGGMGISTMYGGFFVLDWFGTLMTTLTGMMVGILAEKVLIMRWSGILLMIPWIWFRTRDPYKLLYVVIANMLYWYAMRSVLMQYFTLKSRHTLPDSSTIAEMQGMQGFWQFVRRFSIPHLMRKYKQKKESVNNEQEV